MIETAAMFSARPPTGGNRSGPGYLSGGHAALLADMAQNLKLPLAPLSEQTCAQLKAIYPAWWNASNPIDAWGTGWDPARFEKTLDIVASDPAAPMIAMTIMPQPARRISSEVAEVLHRVAKRSGKPFALISDSSGGPREPSVVQTLDGSGIAYLSGLRNGMTAIARWLQAHRRRPLGGCRRVAGPVPNVRVSLRAMDESSRLHSWPRSASDAESRRASAPSGKPRSTRLPRF